jgi:molybdopterin-biosynthesis enzyme MoeA-like protein
MRLDVGPDSLPSDIAPAQEARIYILPGIPGLLRAKIDALEAIAGELPRGEKWTLLTVHTTLDESSLAGPLDEVARAHPQVEIGSYPRWNADEAGRLRVRVRVTLEATGAHAEQASRARAALLAKLDPELVLPEPESGSESGS